jgi:hypothetical protein
MSTADVLLWRMGSLVRLRSLVVVTACAVTFTFATSSAESNATTRSTVSRSAPKSTDPAATATPLVNRFFTLIQKHDVAGLKRFLSPAFQLERADGSGSAKADYLAHLPTVQSFAISNLSAGQSGSVLVVRYLASATGLVNGKPYTPGLAPRLSVFAWNGSAWQITAHANFNPLTG